jgi:hypothetical protein
MTPPDARTLGRFPAFYTATTASAMHDIHTARM